MIIINRVHYIQIYAAACRVGMQSSGIILLILKRPFHVFAKWNKSNKNFIYHMFTGSLSDTRQAGFTAYLGLVKIAENLRLDKSANLSLIQWNSDCQPGQSCQKKELKNNYYICALYFFIYICALFSFSLCFIMSYFSCSCLSLSLSLLTLSFSDGLSTHGIFLLCLEAKLSPHISFTKTKICKNKKFKNLIYLFLYWELF